jgi:glycerol-3-phosphate dehydrogenase (NAD(P)+)
MARDGENRRYLPGVSLRSICVSANLEQVLKGATWIVSAVPCAGVPDLVPAVAALSEPGAKVISGTKGLHPQIGARGAQMWSAGFDGAHYAALSGPNLAREIALGVPTSSVIASLDDETARSAQELFTSTLFRVYTNTDLLGVELGGALKNVVAIAAGVCDGLGFGDNAKAALMTRHWREMTRLAVAQGAHETTLFGLSGVGDLFATCASPHSRNHSLGTKLGRGESLAQAQSEVAQVAEGVHTTRAALQLSERCGVELPVTEQLAALLFEGQDVRVAVQALMGREGRAE